LAGPIFFNQQAVDTANATADIQDRQPCQIVAIQHRSDLFGATGRQEAISPDRLQRVNE
jgi:sulfur transfer protein SufE